jgi:fimbrial chaperone protein
MIEDTYSKKTIRYWLLNYQAMKSGDQLPGSGANSGPKAYDGISSRVLTKIMIDEAIAAMPGHMKSVVFLRWLYPVGILQALSLLSITQKAYYRRCDRAVDFIYKKVNGLACNYGDLAEKIIDY